MSSAHGNPIATLPTIDWNLLPPTSTLVYCLIIASLIYKYKRQNEKKAAKFAQKLDQDNLKLMPTPPTYPIIGHLYLMRDYGHNPWEGFNAIRRDYGDIVSLKMGIHQMVLVSSFKCMQEILLEKGHIFADRPTFPRHHIVFGGDKEHSLALCNWSNTHKARRKFCKRGVVPSNVSARNQLLERVVSEHCVKFLNTLSNADTTCLTKKDILYLTGDIFMEFLCDEKFSHQNKSYQIFNSDCDFIFWDINQCYLLDFLPYLTTFGFGFPYLKELKHITDRCRYFIDDNIFEPRRAAHIANQNKPTNDDQDDYLDSIIKQELAHETSMSLEDYKVGFADLLAGHSAVSNILMKLLGHLALDEKAQDMIYEEAKKNDIQSKNYRPNLPVASAALQEALRLASSPIVPHVARQDTSIGEYFVPKGSAVLFNCYNVNLSDKLWSNPREFNLLRFLDVIDTDSGEQGYKLSIPECFMPFSVGSRSCLGYKMVEAISIVAVSQICGRFRIEANDENLVRRLLEPKGTVALNPLKECFKLNLSIR